MHLSKCMLMFANSDHFQSYFYGIGFDLMVFNATFNNISAISWRLALLVEETGGPGENHRIARL